MKKILIFSASFLVLLICAFFGAWHWLNTRMSPVYIADLTRSALGQPVKIKEEPKISFFPLALSLRSVNFDYNQEDLKIAVAVEDCYIKLAILPLLNGNVEIEEIFLEKPLVEAAYFASREQSQTEDSVLNPGALDYHVQISPNNSSPRAASPAQTSIPVKRLIAKNGNLVFNNNANEINLENINFTAENLDSKNTWHIKSDFGLQIFSITGTIESRRIVDGNLAFKTNFHYYQPTLTFRQTQITFTDKAGDPTFTPLSVAFDGALNYSLQEFNIASANITMPQGSMNISGKGTARTFSGRAAAELSLPTLLSLAAINPVHLQNHYIFMDGQLELDNKNFSYSDATVKCAGTDGSGRLDGTFAQNGASININANLVLGDINLNKFIKENTDLVSGSSPPSITYQTDKNQPGNIIKTESPAHNSEKNPVNKPQSAPVNYNIDCKIKSISWNKLLTENFDFKIADKENFIDLNNLTFEWAKGKVQGTGEADPVHRQYRLNLTGEKLILGNILRQFGENEIKGGLTNFSARLQANGDSWHELLKTMAGNLEINCQNTKVPALEELARMLPIPGGSKFDFPYLVNNLDIQCVATKGIAACKPVSFTAGSLKGSGNGIINLPDNWIDGNLTLSTLGINLPVNFRGKFNDLSWSMGSGFFDEIRKLIP